MIKKYALLVLFFASVLLIMPNFSFGATNVEMQIQSLMAQIQALQKQLSELQAQQSSVRAWCHTFNTNLRVGDQSDEVTNLDRALIKEGFLNSDEVFQDARTVLNFDESTASAVTGFQQKYRDEILTPLGLKYGTGYVGKSTRTKLNQLYGCGEVTKPPVSAGYLEIEPSSASIAVGGSVSMQAMYQPPMPKCPEGFACPQVMPARYPVVVEWTSSNPKVASVDVIGSCGAIGCPIPTTVLIKGNSNGTADIKTSYKSPSGTFLTATAKVTVAGIGTNNPPVINGIPAIPSVIKADQSVLFSWGATDADGDNLSWSVSWGDGTGVAGACQSPNPQNKQGWNFAVSHAWAKSGTYTVKATVNDCNGGSNEHTFNVTVGSISIAPSITVISPNGGEQWQVGQSYTVGWKHGNSAKVTIYLTTSNSTPYSATKIIADNIPASNIAPASGSYLWTVPADVGTYNNYRIFVRDSANESIFDVSDAPFSIVAIPGTATSGTSLQSGNQNLAAALVNMKATLDQMQVILKNMTR